MKRLPSCPGPREAGSFIVHDTFNAPIDTFNAPILTAGLLRSADEALPIGAPQTGLPYPPGSAHAPCVPACQHFGIIGDVTSLFG
jgi:hypothetical protein